MATERRQVEDPFKGREAARRFRGVNVSPARINPTEFEVAEPSVRATDIVEGLVQFAGAASDAYTKKLQKQVEADKVVQAQRAVLGLLPSQDATEGGYTAHMAVGIKNQQLAAQVKLNQLAEQDMTDDEWEDVLRSTYEEVDQNLLSEYPSYADRPEYQKMTSLSLAEIMPQITSARESAKLGHEINKRLRTEEDLLINELKLTTDPDQTMARFEQRTEAMKLTQSQKESILTKVALTSTQDDALELTKMFKGERGTTLFERTGQLQAEEQKRIAARKAYDAGELGLEVNSFQQDFINGKYTKEEAARLIDKRNRETQGRFMSQAGVVSMFRQADEEHAKRFRMQKLITAVSGDRPAPPGYTKKEVKTAVSESYSIYLQSGVENIQKTVPPEQQAKAVADLQLRATQSFGDISARQGIVIDQWKASFSALANSNIAAEVKDVGQLEALPDHLNTSLQQLQQLSPSAFSFYMDNLDSRERDILRHTMNLVESGVPIPQALARGQAFERNRVPVSQSKIEKVVESLTEDIDAGIFNPDIPDSMRAFYGMEVRRKLATYPDPSSDLAKREISSYFQKQWTTIDKGVRVKGSPSRLTELTGLESQNLGRGFQGMIEANRQRIEPALAAYGVDFDDIIPDVDPETGLVTFRTPSGIEIISSIPLSRMKADYMKYKSLIEKRMNPYADPVTGVAIDYDWSG